MRPSPTLWIREVANARIKLQKNHFWLLDFSLRTKWISVLTVEVFLRLMSCSFGPVQITPFEKRLTIYLPSIYLYQVHKIVFDYWYSL